MSHRFIRLATVVVLLLPAGAWAGTIHVNNLTGDDKASGMVPDIRTLGEGPVATIARALQIAVGTDTIMIANTGIPYSESVVLDRPGLGGSEPAPSAVEGHLYRYRYRPDRSGSDRMSNYPLIIEGNGAVLRGTKRLSPEVWRRVGEGTYRYQPYRKGNYQLLVNGTLAQEVPVKATADAPPALEPLQWCAFRGFIYLRVEPKKFIDEYEFEAPLYEVGLGLHSARNVIVRNLNFEAFRLDGIAVTGNSRNVQLVNVRSTANGRAGLSVSGTSQVQVGGLDLSGNRKAERLVLVKGLITDLPEAQVPPKPAPLSWDLKSGRYMQIVAPHAEPPATAACDRTGARE